ncbi:hypothetical protein D3C72_1813860 [compost metagenome]
MVSDVSGAGAGERGAQVQGNLVAKKIEVHPGIGASPFLATQHATIKAAGGIQIGDVKGEVKKAAHLQRIAAGALIASAQATIDGSAAMLSNFLKYWRAMATSWGSVGWSATMESTMTPATLVSCLMHQSRNWFRTRPGPATSTSWVSTSACAMSAK